MSYFFVGDLNILKDKRLTPIDRLVYFSLVSFMSSKDGKCYPRYATIKRDLGISKASINRSVKHLAKLKLITVKRLSSTNLYLLTQQVELEIILNIGIRNVVRLPNISGRKMSL